MRLATCVKYNGQQSLRIDLPVRSNWFGRYFSLSLILILSLERSVEFIIYFLLILLIYEEQTLEKVQE
jgi:hypothetical protein